MNDKSLGQLANGRDNNLDLIRFIAAVFVIYSHSFPLGSGDNSREIILRLTGGKWDAGALAVATFFMISGFLITQSFERSRSLSSYLKARILRIFPGLAAALLFSTFVIGTIFTSLPVKQYLFDPKTYDYLKSFFLYPLRWNLPGVFETNVYKGSINGSLWTIPFEVLCYLIVALLGVIGILRFKKMILFLFFVTVYYHFFNSSISLGFTHIFGLEVKKLMELFCYFSSGMVLYLYRNGIPINKYIAMICILMLGFSFLFGGFKELYIFFGSYLIIYLAYTPQIRLSKFSKYGDFSYGLYIYAFPVQQTITHIFGGKMSAEYNFILSFIVTLILAVFSWHFIEKHALRLKKVQFIRLPAKFDISIINSKYSMILNSIYKINWPIFLVSFIVLFTGMTYYNIKPSSITFPYTKNNNIFQEGWLPQSNSENYRWISKSAVVALERPNQAKTIVIEGYVPEAFIEVNKLYVFVNNNKIADIDLKAGGPIAVNTGLNNLSKQINLRLEFNGSHRPKPNEPDQREMSALINKIELR